MNPQPSYTQILPKFGIEALNPMQEAAGRAILEQPGDVILDAPTGTGKTLAYLLPLYRLLDPNGAGVQAVVIVPARELAMQIEQVWKTMATGFKVNVCYGGHPMATEIRNLSEPPALLIGTPGRLADHLERSTVDLSGVQTLVLDEFDKGLELGFQEQMEKVIRALPGLRKRVLVSATAGTEIPAFTGLQEAQRLSFPAGSAEASGLTLRLVVSEEKDKTETLYRLLGTLHSEPALIFCNHREAAERISESLNRKGIGSTVYHGGMEQAYRERALILFRNGSVRYLVTTDLAARGLDIPEMKHVIHYQLPVQESEFLHRNGRTARMHATGTAYLMLYGEEKRPSYVPADLETVPLPENPDLPGPPEFRTLSIGGGRKNKIARGDIVGFLLQKGGLEKEELGRVEVGDFLSFAAVKADRATGVLDRVREEKLKGKKYRIELVRP
ncbi:DEAD/DEAH box helicase [Larkinella soli]|uniref:DEAD/DEAH box helicase n=1 Tax=Larkinella soli TaxID=1770527 RepID=UPI000FFC1ADC|nr:DEAD/DEAH box helicase [Larkinella soli]